MITLPPVHHGRNVNLGLARMKSEDLKGEYGKTGGFWLAFPKNISRFILVFCSFGAVIVGTSCTALQSITGSDSPSLQESDVRRIASLQFASVCNRPPSPDNFYAKYQGRGVWRVSAPRLRTSLSPEYVGIYNERTSVWEFVEIPDRC